VIILALGLLGGLYTWPVAELILSAQARFPSYLVFLIVLGAVSGAVIGAFFGAAEGITSRIKPRIVSGMVLGAAVGCVGGAIGLLVGQAALWIIGELFLRSYGNFRLVVLPVSRAIGWGALGIFIGATEGVRAGSARKIGVGVIGGLAGGLIGGFALEYAHILAPSFPWWRLVGFLLLGFSISLLYALVESGMSLGVLRILTGPLKGKEYLLNQNRLRLGRARRNEIALPDYADLAALQARIRIRKGEVVLSRVAPSPAMLVNEKKVEETRLKLGDVIRIGSVRLFYRYQ
jgi:Inner membrane component of T3SS, cytoplasmic domain